MMSLIKRLLQSLAEPFPVLIQIYRCGRDRLRRQSAPVRTPWGFTLSGHLDMASGGFEPVETAMIQKLLEETKIMVNIGANVGYYCCHALNAGVSVIAVEPNEENLHYLLKNIRNNGWEKNAEVFPVALSHESGVLEMWGGGTGASLVKGWASIPESYVNWVPVLTLDRILGDSLDHRRALILMDVEGAELSVLRGAIRTLQHQPRPRWFVEIAIHEHQPSGVQINPNLLETFEMFYSSGYRAYTAEQERREIVKSQVVDAVTGEFTFTTHNFIFEAEDS